MRFDFGGPTDGIFQTAFVVEDLDAAMEQFSARMGVGPWTSLRDVSPEGTIYRGAPAQAALHVGFGFSGSMLYELMASGAIESVHIGRLRRIPVDCLTDFVNRRRREERELLP